MTNGEHPWKVDVGEFTLNLKRKIDIIYVSTAWRTGMAPYSQDVDDATHKYCKDRSEPQHQGTLEDSP